MEKEVDGAWMPTLTPVTFLGVDGGPGKPGLLLEGQVEGGVIFWELFWPEIKGSREVEN